MLLDTSMLQYVNFFDIDTTYLAKSCGTQMGNDKNREQIRQGHENQVPLSFFAPPPYAYLVFPEKEKDL